MDNEYCEHCWPIKQRNHTTNHINYYIDKAMWNFCVLLGDSALKNKKIAKITEYSTGLLFELLSLLKIIKFIDNPDKTKLYNRSLIFFEEAQKRELNIKAIKLLGKYTNNFKFTHNGKRYYYDGIPLAMMHKNSDIDDKNKIKKLFDKNNIPIAHGNCFVNINKAIRFGLDLGFPLVVKPNNGSLSKHVTCNIRSEEELIKAIKIAKKFSPDFIIEKYIQGSLFRATVVGKKQVFISQKEKANIVGDGHSTIENLIKKKNNDKKRGKTHAADTTLHEILLDNALEENLGNNNLRLNSVISKNRKIYLQDKYILSHGCDIINCSHKTHTDNKEMFLMISKLLDTHLVGIDFICKDIERSHKEQQVAVLETNSLPYIDMHQHPSHGEPEPVAEIVWDVMLDYLEN